MASPRQSAFIPGESPIAPGDRLDFACGCCGGCCTETTPYLIPYDLWRAARHLQRATGEILAETLVVRGETPAPLLQFAQIEATGECLWLDHASRRCRIHPARPLSCRAFPVGVRHEQDGDRLSKAHTLPECLGENRAQVTVSEYLDGQLTPEDWRWSRAYAALNREIFAARAPGVAEEEFIAYYLQTLFDLDRMPGEDFPARFAQAALRIRRAAELTAARPREGR